MRNQNKEEKKQKAEIKATKIIMTSARSLSRLIWKDFEDCPSNGRDRQSVRFVYSFAQLVAATKWVLFFSSALSSCDTKSFWLAFDIYWCLCVTNVRCVSAVWNYYRFRWPAVKFVLWLQSFRCRDERLKLRVRGDSCIHTHTHVKPIRAASHQMRPHVCLHAIKWLNIICGVLVC